MQLNIEKLIQNDKKVSLAIEILAICLILLSMVNRVKYGIDFTDESWYVAEPYAVAQLGAVPFVNNITQTPGFTIPLAFAFKLYVWINETTDGIFYFSRILYIFMHFLISALTIWVVNRYTSFKMPLWTLCVLLAANHCHSLYDLTYNTIGMIYFPLIMALVFAEYDDNTFKSFLWGGLAGIFAVRATMGTPQVIVGLFIVLFYLCTQKKIKRIAGIVVGAIAACVVLFSVISFFYGIERILAWFSVFFQQVYFSIESVATWESTQSILIEFFRPVTFLVIAIGILRMKMKNRRKLFELILQMAIVGSILLGILLSVKNQSYNGFLLLTYTWGLPYMYGVYGYRKYRYMNKILIICMAYLSIFFFASFSDIYGFNGSRAYWNVVPLLLTICIFVNTVNKRYNFHGMINYIAFLVCVASFSAFSLWCQYSYVYRDKPIQMLSAKVADGIWRGLYTTEKRAKNVVSLERYIQTITNKKDRILCLDQVPFGYLMIHGKICSPTTADASAYSYKVNNPKTYYWYFEMEKCVPNKIIYLDFGRDKRLSIDEPSWKFNEFVMGCYRFASEYRNELFLVREYVLEDRKRAMTLISQKAFL